MAELSTDGNCIIGTQFPDPEPPKSTIRYSVLRDKITGLAEANYDDAKGDGNAALCVLIYIGAQIIIANDSYDELFNLWQGTTPTAPDQTATDTSTSDQTATTT